MKEGGTRTGLSLFNEDYVKIRICEDHGNDTNINQVSLREVNIRHKREHTSQCDSLFNARLLDIVVVLKRINAKRKS